MFSKRSFISRNINVHIVMKLMKKKKKKMRGSGSMGSQTWRGGGGVVRDRGPTICGCTELPRLEHQGLIPPNKVSMNTAEEA